jgi:hypothetical protein
VQFGLQFKGEDGEAKAGLTSSPVSALPTALPMPKEKPPAPPTPTAENADEVLPTAGEVVNLDAFRKK